jgi:FkbM family methyltransferase
MLTSYRPVARRWFDRAFWTRADGVEQVGSEADWWVCTRLLAPGTCVLSGGAGKDVSFELELVQRFGCLVALFDPSPIGKLTMGSVANQHPNLQFFELGLAKRNTNVRFAPPADQDEGSFRVLGRGSLGTTIEFACVSPRQALEHAGFSDCGLCKLDIEGFEYEVLEAVLAAGLRPAQIAVEFHHWMPGIPWRRTLSSLCQLRRAGYRIVRKRQTDFLFVRQDLLP